MKTNKPKRKTPIMRLEDVESKLDTQGRSQWQEYALVACAVMAGFSFAFLCQGMYDNNNDKFLWGTINQYNALWFAMMSVVCAIVSRE